MTATQTPAATIDRFLAAVCGDHETGPIWSDDAVLDAVVPDWRFTRTGDDRIRAQFRKWYREGGELDEVRRLAVAGGEVVELTVKWVEGGVPHAARQVHVLELDPDGLISRDRMWCGGQWPADLLAKMEAAGKAR